MFTHPKLSGAFTFGPTRALLALAIAGLVAAGQAGASWSLQTTVPTKRDRPGVVAVNGKIYVIGGSTLDTGENGPQLKTVEIYDLATGQWTAGKDMPTARYALGVAVVNGKIYAVGGGTGSCQRTAAVEEYDPVADVWVTKAPMSVARQDLGVVSVNGQIYAMGGDICANGSPRLEMLDPSDAAATNWTALADMPELRSSIMPIAVGGKIYVLGGSCPGYRTPAILVYDIQANGWSTNAILLPVACAVHGVLAVGSTIYMAGGSDYAMFDQFRQLSLDSGTWTCLGAIPAAAYDLSLVDIAGTMYLVNGSAGTIHACLAGPPSVPWPDLATNAIASMSMPHGNGGAVEWGGKLYVYGGNSTAGRAGALEIYDPATGTWTTGPSMPGGRQDMTAFVLNGKIYSVGGEGPSAGQFSSDVYRYDPVANQWTPLGSFPVAGWARRAAVANGKAYVFGGRSGYSGTEGIVYEYNEAGDSWTAKAPMPIPVMNMGVATYQGNIYVFGGNFKEGETDSAWTNKVQVFNPGSNGWTTADMPWTLGNTEAAAVDHYAFLFTSQVADPSGNLVDNAYVYRYDLATGQWDKQAYMPPMLTDYAREQVPIIDGWAYFTDVLAGSNYSNLAYRLQLGLPTWPDLATNAVASMGMPHGNGGAVEFGGKLYVYGGNSTAGRTGALEICDPATGTWTTGPSMPGGRQDMSAFVLNGKLYSVGGEGPGGGQFTSDVYRYDPVANQWTQLHNFPVVGWARRAAVVNGKAYVFGGRSGYGATEGIVYEYDEVGDSWTARAPMPIPVMNMGVATNQGKIYVFGGNFKTDEAHSTWINKLQVFDPVANSWTTADMPWTLGNTEAAIVYGYAYLFTSQVTDHCGTLGGNAYLYRYDLATGQWDQEAYTPPLVTDYSREQVPVIDGWAYFTDVLPGGNYSSLAYRLRLGSLTPPVLDIALYTGLTIHGTAGATYQIQSSTDVGDSKNWTMVATVTLTTTVSLWYDAQPATQPRRFYRVVLVP